MKENIDTEVFNRVVAYLGQHLSGRVTIETICKDNLIGRSQLQKIFSKKSGLGIIEYFSNMKIEAAKDLIRTEQMNFTQISEKLGYTSIHYFSRQFKKVTGMTPSEYASSIKPWQTGVIARSRIRIRNDLHRSNIIFALYLQVTFIIKQQNRKYR